MRRERLLLLLLLTPGLRGMSRGRPHGVAGEGDDTEDRRSGEAGGAVFCAASCFLFGFSSFFFLWVAVFDPVRRLVSDVCLLTFDLFIKGQTWAEFCPGPLVTRTPRPTSTVFSSLSLYTLHFLLKKKSTYSTKKIIYSIRSKL